MVIRGITFMGRFLTLTLTNVVRKGVFTMSESFRGLFRRVEGHLQCLSVVGEIGYREGIFVYVTGFS